MKKIVVIEDNEVLQKIFTNYLKALGYEAPLLPYSEKIVEEIIEENPDCILLDINLRGASGINISRVLKEHPRLKHVPIILNSSFSSHIEREIAERKSGCDICIMKPLTKEDLKFAISKAKVVSNFKIHHHKPQGLPLNK